MGDVRAALRRWLLYPSVVMAASAVGWSLSADRLLGLPHDAAVQALVFALAFLFYNRDRLADHARPDDLLNMAERARWFAAHRRLLLVLMAGAAMGSAGLLALRPAMLPPILAGLGFALAYNVRLLPGGKTPKQLPGLKTPYVAALWTLLVVVAPAANAGWLLTQPAADERRIGWVALALFGLVAAQITINDIRDVTGDRLVGTRTFAVLWGERGARRVALGCAALTAIAAVALRSAGLLAAAAYAAAYTAAYRRTADGSFRWPIEASGCATWLAVAALG